MIAKTIHTSFLDFADVRGEYDAEDALGVEHRYSDSELDIPQTISQ